MGQSDGIIIEYDAAYFASVFKTPSMVVATFAKEDQLVLCDDETSLLLDFTDDGVFWCLATIDEPADADINHAGVLNGILRAFLDKNISHRGDNNGVNPTVPQTPIGCVIGVAEFTGELVVAGDDINWPQHASSRRDADSLHGRHFPWIRLPAIRLVLF